MNLTNLKGSKDNIFDKNMQIDKKKLPFQKINFIGKKNENTQILRKVKNSKNVINNQVDELLLTGFNGTMDDFYKVYGKRQSLKICKPKEKIKLGNSLLFKSDVAAGPIKLTKIQEFNFMNKIKTKEMKKLLDKYTNKNESKYNFNFDKSKENIKNKSALDITSKNFSHIYFNNSNYPYIYFNKDNIINKQKVQLEKLKKINKIRKILNIKSRNALKNESFKKNKIKKFKTYQEDNNQNKEIEPKKIIEDYNEKEKSKQMDEFEEKENEKEKNIKGENEEKEGKKEIEEYKTQNLKIKEGKNEINERNNKNIKKIFKKYFKKKNDVKKLKKVLDPLRSGYKTNLKEIYQYEGKDKQFIFIKRSTANLISFGKSFQIMSDEHFYKDHKRIISVYPNIEKEANILVMEKKPRKENLIEKLETNERKIRFIVNDSDALLKTIKSKSLKLSKSQSSFHKIKLFK